MTLKEQIQRLQRNIDMITLDPQRLEIAVKLAQIKALLPRPIDVMKREELIKALKFTGGNKWAAARVLGVTKNTIPRMMERYGVKVVRTQVVVEGVPMGKT